MEPLRQLDDAQALPMEVPDGLVPLPQFLPIAGAVAPAPASIRPPGDVKIDAVRVFLDLLQKLGGQNILCFLISHVSSCDSRQAAHDGMDLYAAVTQQILPVDFIR